MACLESVKCRGFSKAKHCLVHPKDHPWNCCEVLLLFDLRDSHQSSVQPSCQAMFTCCAPLLPAPLLPHPCSPAPCSLLLFDLRDCISHQCSQAVKPCLHAVLPCSLLPAPPAPCSYLTWETASVINAAKLSSHVYMPWCCEMLRSQLSHIVLHVAEDILWSCLSFLSLRLSASETASITWQSPSQHIFTCFETYRNAEIYSGLREMTWKYTLKTSMPIEDGDSIFKLLRRVSHPEIKECVAVSSDICP